MDYGTNGDGLKLGVFNSDEITKLELFSGTGVKGVLQPLLVLETTLLGKIEEFSLDRCAMDFE